MTPKEKAKEYIKENIELIETYNRNFVCFNEAIDIALEELIKQIDKKMVADGLGNVCIDEGVWEKIKSLQNKSLK